MFKYLGAELKAYLYLGCGSLVAEFLEGMYEALGSSPSSRNSTVIGWVKASGLTLGNWKLISNSTRELWLGVLLQCCTTPTPASAPCLWELPAVPSAVPCSRAGYNALKLYLGQKLLSNIFSLTHSSILSVVSELPPHLLLLLRCW